MNPQQNRPSPTMRGRRNRLRLLYIFLFAFMTWAGMTLWDQLGQVQAKKAELERALARLQETQEQNEQYKLEIIRLHDPEYIEQLLRRELHMTKEGETLFIETK
jgi:cell division protein DivIC